MAKLTLMAVQNLISEQTKVLTDEIEKLRNEVVQLRTELAAVKKCVVEEKPNDTPIAQQTSSNLANVVKSCVQTAFQEEKDKNDVILSNLPENESKPDSNLVSELCHTLKFTSKSKGMSRLGRKVENQHRLLRVSFDSQFDARAFKSKFDELKQTESIPPNVRVRLARSKAEQDLHASNIKLARGLNEKAKKDNADYSFSVRDSGEIWKFQKNEEGVWRRVREWTAPSTGELSRRPSGGNGSEPRVNGQLQGNSQETD